MSPRACQTGKARRCEPGSARRPRIARGRGLRVADFARGRGPRGAGRRFPATLPTLRGPPACASSGPTRAGPGPTGHHRPKPRPGQAAIRVKARKLSHADRGGRGKCGVGGLAWLARARVTAREGRGGGRGWELGLAVTHAARGAGCCDHAQKACARRDGRAPGFNVLHYSSVAQARTPRRKQRR